MIYDFAEYKYLSIHLNISHRHWKRNKNKKFRFQNVNYVCFWFMVFFVFLLCQFYMCISHCANNNFSYFDFSNFNLFFWMLRFWCARSFYFTAILPYKIYYKYNVQYERIAHLWISICVFDVVFVKSSSSHGGFYSRSFSSLFAKNTIPFEHVKRT